MVIETPIEKVPMVQKMLIDKGISSGKPVIIATQMLLSMVNNPRPTIAEVTDVANAILDGTNAIMLFEEAAAGKYPVQAVAMMYKVADDAESGFPYNIWTKRLDGKALSHTVKKYKELEEREEKIEKIFKELSTKDSNIAEALRHVGLL